MRWNHATRGWIAPDVFIPIAEETGLIAALGDWVIRRRVQAAGGLGEPGPGTPDDRGQRIGAAVRARGFRRLGAAAHCGNFKVRPQLLELEITESLLMRNVDDTTACMQRFRAAGVSLSIDDFGTGYSSLGYLRQFPVDSLKIDRSFVKDLAHQRRQRRHLRRDHRHGDASSR